MSSAPAPRIVASEFAEAPRSIGKAKTVQCTLNGGRAFVCIDLEDEAMRVIDAKEKVLHTINAPHGFNMWNAQAIATSENTFFAAFFREQDGKSEAHVLACSVGADLAVRQHEACAIRLHGPFQRYLRFEAAAPDMCIYDDHLYQVSTGKMVVALPESFRSGLWALNHDASQAVHVDLGGKCVKRFSLPDAKPIESPLTHNFSVRSVAFLGEYVVLAVLPHSSIDEAINTSMFDTKMLVVSPGGSVVAHHKIQLPTSKLALCPEVMQGGPHTLACLSATFGTAFTVRIDADDDAAAHASPYPLKRSRVAVGEE